MAILRRLIFLLLATSLLMTAGNHLAGATVPMAQSPLFFPGTLPPINMLVMGRDHTLYYEAYNDASDLNGDGILDVGYKPNNVTYLGYFDSYKCYTYSGGDGRFNPASVTVNKKCSGTSEWSGDFLNYVTTARIDALRKVLYGGHRVVDDENLTVLERSYIPQDAHSWGKEYQSVARDGYDIQEYTPLDLPTTGTYHLFANTTLLKTGNKEPLMRVLTNSNYRIWEWVAIERPVAGDNCLNGGSGPSCETAGGTVWEIIPGTALQLTQTVHKITSGVGTHPSDAGTFGSLVTNNAITGNLCGAQSVSTINGTGNPFNSVNGCSNDNYLNIFTGQINIDQAGTYTFAVDGDDAVDLQVDGTIVASWYGGHGNCNCNDHSGSISLSAGLHTLRFRHEEAGGGDNYYLRWRRTVPASARTDYTVRVKVCDSTVGLETNCKQYPNTHYKPTGLLHDYGETDRMLFGLITGSYGRNLEGGVLRKNIESFQDEVNPNTGQLTPLVGIIRTLDQLRITRFQMDSSYEYLGGWLVTEPMSAGSSFYDWGNPVGEMMYESLRYFSGKTSPTSAFVPTLTSIGTLNMERVNLRDYAGSNQYLYLPAPTWKDPYKRADNPRPWCTAGVQLVISDVNPSYDTDQVPGSYFNPSYSGDISGLDVKTEANNIWAAENGGSSQHFIGQSGSLYDGAPSEKTVTGLGYIRGLAPSEPTKQGGYYSAAIARYAYKNDLRADLQGEQKIQNFSVALASPLPKIEIPVGDHRITLVPFAKSVGGWSGLSAAKGSFQPTNQIVDFFVETFANTDTTSAHSDADATVNGGRPFVKFRINYEDVEQGADHDMDAIAVYEAKANADNTLTVTLTSEYAAGSIIQHMGYVISGTTADGAYLEIRDKDTDTGSDPSYFLNTPSGLLPGACAVASPPAACNNALPLLASRTFTPSSTPTATLLKDPLWYAAKYGSDGNDKLAKGETSPNYFLVTNASTLQKQLDGAFKAILGITTSASAVATNSTRLGSESLVYQARFRSDDWTGELRAFPATAVVTTTGDVAPLWDAGEKMPSIRNIFTLYVAPPALPHGVPFAWADLAVPQKTALNINPKDATVDVLGESRLNWLRGDDSQEQKKGGSFRNRSRALGDIVNFNPVLVKADYSGYELLPSSAGGDKYLSFYEANLQNRHAVVYVGANDGMLHAFDAETGVEKFAYVPGLLIPALNQLTNPAYVHRYYVDGQAFAGDAYLNNANSYSSTGWNTVLVASLGAGGRGVFALDVTDPDHFSASKVLWEFTAANDPDLGYVMDAPVVVRMADGQWAAVFGNGYNSDSQQAFLFVVNLQTGALIKKIPTGEGSGVNSNGLAAPELVPDATGTITTAYAGDLLGNLWKFDLSATTAGTSALVSGVWSCTGWCSAFSQSGAFKPLFKTVSQNGEPQPITARPAIIRQTGEHTDGGYVILFGTGRYFASGDNVVNKVNEPVQSLYGIWDHNAQVSVNQSTRSTVLQEQTIVAEGSQIAALSNRGARVLSQNEVDWTSKKGWFLDLWSPVAKALTPGEREGERVVLRPVVRHDRVIFTSLIPSSDPCVFGGSGWVMEFDAQTGGRSTSVIFDINNDSVFNEDDKVEVDSELVPISALKIKGIPSLPTIIRTDKGVEVRLISTTASSDGQTGNDAAVAAARAAAATAAATAATAAATAKVAAAAAASAAASAEMATAQAAASAAASAASAAASAAQAAASAAAAVAVIDPAAAAAAAAAQAAADAAVAAATAAGTAASHSGSASDPAVAKAQAAEAAAAAQAAAAYAKAVSDIVSGLGDPRVLSLISKNNLDEYAAPDPSLSEPPRWRQIR